MKHGVKGTSGSPSFTPMEAAYVSFEMVAVGFEVAEKIPNRGGGGGGGGEVVKMGSDDDFPISMSCR